VTVPGSLMGAAYEMSVEDALVLVAFDQIAAGVLDGTDELRELRRAAHAVIEHHAEDVLVRYMPGRSADLRVVKS
jgi:hypothetical protein